VSLVRFTWITEFDTGNSSVMSAGTSCVFTSCIFTIYSYHIENFCECVAIEVSSHARHVFSISSTPLGPPTACSPCQVSTTTSPSSEPSASSPPHRSVPHPQPPRSRDETVDGMLRAAERGHEVAVKSAIADVDVIAKDAAKNTAILLAAYRGHPAVVELMSLLSNKLCLRTSSGLS
jgi:hypothetical protein